MFTCLLNLHKIIDMENLQSIADRWCSPSLSDKGTTHSYITRYESLFESYRKLPVTLLEVGVKSGASIRMWNEYFVSEDKKIIGVDIILDRPYQVDLNFPHISLFKGSATDKNFMSQFEDIDIFIDDGSHELNDQLCTMELMLPKIKKGGVYVIEDIDLSNEETARRFEDLHKSGKGNLLDLRNERPNSVLPSFNNMYFMKL